MGVGGQLLEDVALARTAGTEFDQVVVSLHERGHPQQGDPLGLDVELFGLETGGADQEVPPLLGRERLTALGQDVQHVRLGHLDGTEHGDAEGPAVLLLGDQGVVLERDLSVEAVGQHPLVVHDDPVGDLDVLQSQTGQLSHVAVVLGVETGADDVDQLDRAILAGLGLEQLLVARADGAALELLLDDLQPFLDLLWVGAGAEATQQELDHVGRDGVLAGVLAHQILADEIAGEGFVRESVEMVHLRF